MPYQQSNKEQNLLLLMETAREGIQYTRFKQLVAHIPFTMNDWAEILHVSERTLQRYKKNKKRFDVLQSEKVLQITLLYNLGIDVFGEKETFDRWLESSNVSLGGLKPKKLLDNTFGIRIVRDELIRIEQGVLA